MTIQLCKGDMFESGAEALVCAANAQGRLGTGQALEVKKRYLTQVRWFERHAQRGYAEHGQVCFEMPGPTVAWGPMEPGHRLSTALFLLDQHRAHGAAPLILFACTKGNPARPSRVDWVRRCAGELAEAVIELGIRSIAIPALGCGLGQRHIRRADAFGWTEVRPLLEAAAARAPTCTWLLYEPQGGT